MPRRHSARQDSLELLLDTICNTFGGVLFIAILVVLLLQQAGSGPAHETAVTVPLSPVELQDLTLRMESAADELARLRQNRDSQNTVIQNFAPEAIRQLLAARDAAALRQESLQTVVDQLLLSNTELVTQIETLAAENEATREELDAARARFLAAESKLEEARQARVQVARLPVLRSAFGKQEIGIILRYGRLYVWHKYGPDQVRLGLNTDEFIVVSEDGDGLVTRPKPTAGVVLDETPASQAAVKRVLQRFNPRTSYLVVIARPDSYGEFQFVRDRAIEMGMEYRLMPTGKNDAISDRGGRGGKVQ
jgi:hypothetical protein